MKDYLTLKERFRETPCLVLDGGNVRLVTETQGLEIAKSFHGGLIDAVVVMNVGKALEQFRLLVGSEDREFSAREISVVTGLPYPPVDRWTRDGIIRASVAPAAGFGHERRYSFADAFAAGCLAGLRRQGATLSMLRKASRLLSIHPVQLEPTKPARALAGAALQ